MTDARQGRRRTPEERRDDFQVWVSEIDNSETSLMPDQVRFLEDCMRKMDRKNWKPTPAQWAWMKDIHYYACLR